MHTTPSQNVHKALECKQILRSYVSIFEYAFCSFFFGNLSGALFEHKQSLCVSVRVETTESCILDVIKSINISLMNYSQLFFRFCAKSTTIVVFGIVCGVIDMGRFHGFRVVTIYFFRNVNANMSYHTRVGVRAGGRGVTSEARAAKAPLSLTKRI